MIDSKTSPENWGSGLPVEHGQRVDGPLSTIRRGAGRSRRHSGLDRTAPGVVRQPRNFLIYRTENGLAAIGRLLHDAMEMAQRLEAGRPWE